MKTRKISAVLLSAVMLASAFGLSSCGGEESNTLQILAESSYVDTEQLDAYAETFSAGSDALAAAGKTAEFTGLSVGTEDGDPTVYAASTMKAGAMIAANEVDMMLCSLDEAARNARGEYYYNLEELFTPEELAQIPEEDLLSFDLVDEEGNPTGEKMPVCGVKISGNEALDSAIPGEEYGLFIVGNTDDLDLAKEVFWEIVNG